MSQAVETRSRPRWSQDLLDEVLRLNAKGLAASEIGRIIGKSRDSVLGQIWRAKHPVNDRPRRVYAPKPPREIIDSSERGVWNAWGLESPHELRRAIWARARRGARKTLANESA